MLINLAFYKDKTVTEIRKKTEEYFREHPNLRINGSTIWLGNMYVDFNEKIVSINVFNENTEWKQTVSTFLRNVLENEEVYISTTNNNGKNNSKYFKKVTTETDIDIVYLGEKKDVKTVSVEKDPMNRMSLYVSTIIDKLKKDIFVEGVFYVGGNPRPTILLEIVYNDWKFDYKYTNEQRDEIIKTIGMDLKIETIAYWEYFNEQRRRKKLDYPIEFMLRYGTILYDKDGKLEVLKKQLENDEEIESDISHWLDACKFEPPLQLIKK